MQSFDAGTMKTAVEEQLIDLLHVIRYDDGSVQSLPRLGASSSTKMKDRSMEAVLTSKQQRGKVSTQVKKTYSVIRLS